MCGPNRETHKSSGTASTRLNGQERRLAAEHLKHIPLRPYITRLERTINESLKLDVLLREKEKERGREGERDNRNTQ